jgi:hypothetical protein
LGSLWAACRLPVSCQRAAYRVPAGCQKPASRLPGGCQHAARSLPVGWLWAARITQDLLFLARIGRKPPSRQCRPAYMQRMSLLCPHLTSAKGHMNASHVLRAREILVDARDALPSQEEWRPYIRLENPGGSWDVTNG